MKRTLRLPLTRVAVGMLVAALPLSVAAAQTYPRAVIAHCARLAMKEPGFTCNTCDQARSDVEFACEANGGHLPGSEYGPQPDFGPTAQERKY